MFDFEQAYVFYFDIIISPFGLIIPAAALIAALVGFWALKGVKKNTYGAAISFVLFLASLLYVCYKNVTLEGILAVNIFANVFLGAALGFVISLIILKHKETEA